MTKTFAISIENIEWEHLYQKHHPHAHYGVVVKPKCGEELSSDYDNVCIIDANNKILNFERSSAYSAYRWFCTDVIGTSAFIM